jgi:hypothetical protein
MKIQFHVTGFEFAVDFTKIPIMEGELKFYIKQGEPNRPIVGLLHKDGNRQDDFYMVLMPMYIPKVN